jgi:hypothetical protein
MYECMFMVSLCLLQVKTGISGQVVDKETGEGVPGAVVAVDNIEHNITADSHGYFWRLLVQGTYKLKVYAQGYDLITCIYSHFLVDTVLSL